MIEWLGVCLVWIYSLYKQRQFVKRGFQKLHEKIDHSNLNEPLVLWRLRHMITDENDLPPPPAPRKTMIHCPNCNKAIEVE